MDTGTWQELGWMTPAAGGWIHFRWNQDGTTGYQLCRDFDDVVLRARQNCRLHGCFLTAVASDVRFQMLFDGGREVRLLGEIHV